MRGLTFFPPVLSFEIWCTVYTHSTSQFQLALSQILSGHVGLVAPRVGSSGLEDRNGLFGLSW